jgi:hypothetical protein
VISVDDKNEPANVSPDPLAPVAHPFSIELEFDSGVPPGVRAAFEKAVERWGKVIRGGGPPVTVDAVTIPGLRIVAQVVPVNNAPDFSAITEIDGRFLREADIGRAAFLPARATIRLDSAALQALLNGGGTSQQKDLVLFDLVSHETGHALGFSRDVWDPKALLKRSAPPAIDPVFLGPDAKAVYAGLRHFASPTDVPVESFGGDDSLIGHWRQSIFHSELMTFILEPGGNPIGPVTIAALQDMGYDVNPGAAETLKLDLVEPEQGAAARGARRLNCRVCQDGGPIPRPR